MTINNINEINSTDLADNLNGANHVTEGSAALEDVAFQTLDRETLRFWLQETDPEKLELLFARARAVRRRYYGNKVYLRGLIEFTNYCKNDCYYCGIRAGNKKVSRYRLSKEEILECCREGSGLDFRTFVLQGGEDPFYSDEKIVEIVAAIRAEFPDHAITLSIGEKTRQSYKAFYRAGANRFLLRHETADNAHYRKLHPENMDPENRKRCLKNLKEIGFQTGAGLMVGSPYQTEEELLADLMFLKELKPEMVGIGPFIPQSDTPFSDFPQGTLEMTVKMVALTRLVLPEALLPATTALGTVSPEGRERALLAGANVVMPNLSPLGVREKYALYDNKICTGDEAAECKNCIQGRIRSCGFEPDFGRGDAYGRQ